MDGKQIPRPAPGVATITVLKWQLDRRITMIAAAIVLVSVFALATATTTPPDAAPSAAAALAPTATAVTMTTVPATTVPATAVASVKKPATNPKVATTVPAQVRATPTAPAHHAAASTGTGRNVVPTVAARSVATATPLVPTATPSEAQTPLTLSDPNATPINLTTPPWWQSAFDVLWKLALVLALIYGAMRGMAALKQHGFSSVTSLQRRPQSKTTPHFFEKLEEIQLSSQHALHAVRAGDRIILLAQTANNLRPIGEIGPEEAENEMFTALPGRFDRQMLRAWMGVLPAQGDATTADVASADIMDADDHQGIVDANWVTVEPDMLPTPPPTAVPPKRSAEKTELPDDVSQRDILWYAEEHGVSAAAERFGLTRQRVTALRMRYERERTQRQRATLAADREAEVDHPARREGFEETAEPQPLTTARARIAQAAYAKQHPTPKRPVPQAARQAHTPRQPDAIPPTDPSADNVSVQASTVAQALAARLGITLKTR